MKTIFIQYSMDIVVFLNKKIEPKNNNIKEKWFNRRVRNKRKESEKMFKMIQKIFNRSIDEKEIDYETAQKIVKKQNGVLIDVRSKQEYEEGHLPEAILIPLYDLKEKLKEKEPDKQRAIVLYCSSGARSKQAKIQLEQMGYNNVFHIKGGLNSLN